MRVGRVGSGFKSFSLGQRAPTGIRAGSVGGLPRGEPGRQKAAELEPRLRTVGYLPHDVVCALRQARGTLSVAAALLMLALATGPVLAQEATGGTGNSLNPFGNGGNGGDAGAVGINGG